MSLSSPVQNLAIHLILWLLVPFFSLAFYARCSASSVVWMFCLWFTCYLAPISHVWMLVAICISPHRVFLWANNACNVHVNRSIGRVGEIKMHMPRLWVMWMRRAKDCRLFRRLLSSLHFCVLPRVSLQSFWCDLCAQTLMFAPCVSSIEMEECIPCPCVCPSALRLTNSNSHAWYRPPHGSSYLVPRQLQTAYSIRVCVIRRYMCIPWRAHTSMAVDGVVSIKYSPSILHLMAACLFYTCPVRLLRIYIVHISITSSSNP